MSFTNALSTIRLFNEHPLTRDRRLSALARYASWQLISRALPGPVVMPFVGNTRLLIARGMSGAIGNYYWGLHEFNDMAFALHVLRASDLFCDVGSNVGSYAVLAAGAAGADVVAFEPVPTTFSQLQDNIRINGLSERVTIHNLGIGDTPGTLSFSTQMDSMNRVVRDDQSTPAVKVDVTTLDTALTAPCPTMMKIDVEGYESAVIGGAMRTFSDPTLQALIVETNGSGKHYGYSDDDLHACVEAAGFEAVGYDGLDRELTYGRSYNPTGNTLYVRDRSFIEERTRSAPAFMVNGREI